MKAKLITAFVLGAIAITSSSSAGNTCLASADKGQDQRAAGKLKEARATLLACAQSTCNAVIRSDCERWVRDIDKEMPSIVIRVTDSRKHDVLGATLTVDDGRTERDSNAPILVDPGTHVVRARTASGDVAEAKAHVVVGERARIVDVRFDRPLEEDGSRPLDAPPPRTESAPRAEPASSSGTHVLPLALGAVGVVALGTFGAFQWRGRQGFEDLENTCARTHSCTEDQIAPVKTDFTVSAVALGVSAVALGAALYFFVTGKSEPATTGAVRIRPNGLAF
jgi:hypothetical protein